MTTPSSTTGREIDVRDDENQQVSGSSSDRRSSGNGAPSVHVELFTLPATWGLGGVLGELERLGAEHAGLPPRAEALRVELGRFLRDYAPTGSTRESRVWRSVPCSLCDPMGGARG